MSLIVFFFACFSNYKRAGAAGLKAGRWAFYTALSMIAAWIIGSFIVVSIMMFKNPGFRDLIASQRGNRQRVTDYLATQNVFLIEIFLLFCMVGGFLFIRHQIIKKTPTGGEDLQ